MKYSYLIRIIYQQIFLTHWWDAYLFGGLSYTTQDTDLFGGMSYPIKGTYLFGGMPYSTQGTN